MVRELEPVGTGEQDSDSTRAPSPLNSGCIYSHSDGTEFLRGVPNNRGYRRRRLNPSGGTVPEFGIENDVCAPPGRLNIDPEVTRCSDVAPLHGLAARYARSPRARSHAIALAPLFTSSAQAAHGLTRGRSQPLGPQVALPDVANTTWKGVFRAAHSRPTCSRTAIRVARSFGFPGRTRSASRTTTA